LGPKCHAKFPHRSVLTTYAAYHCSAGRQSHDPPLEALMGVGWKIDPATSVSILFLRLERGADAACQQGVCAAPPHEAQREVFSKIHGVAAENHAFVDVFCAASTPPAR